MAKSEERKSLEDKIEREVAKEIAKPEVEANASAVKPISDAVAKEIIPIAINKANLEPWYQSNVTMGALTVILFRLLAHFGYKVPAELHGPILDILIAFGPYVAAVWVLLGRWTFGKPLGEGPILSRLLFWKT